MKTTVPAMLACVLWACPSVAADPAAPIAPSANWAVRLDVAAMQQTAFAKGLLAILDAVDSPVPAEKAQKALEGWQKLGAVDSLTLSGVGASQADAVAVARVNCDLSEVRKSLHIGDETPAQEYGKHTIYTVTPRAPKPGQGNQFVCFHGEATVVAAGSVAGVKSALDMLTGKADNAEPQADLAAMLAPGKGSFLLAAALDVSKIVASVPLPADKPKARRHAAILRKIDTLRVVVGEAEQNLLVTLQATTLRPKDARVLRQAAQGLIALALLKHAEDEHLAALLGAIRVEGEKNAVTIRAAWPVKDLVAQIKAGMKQKAAERGDPGAAY